MGTPQGVRVLPTRFPAIRAFPARFCVGLLGDGPYGRAAEDEDGGMITIEQAARLREAGVLWTPAAGDRFVVPDRNMDHDVFVVSDMTIEVGDFQGRKMIGFNGTTEWALDSIEQREVVWLPREEQLRALLGDEFRTLSAVPGGFRVELTDTAHTAVDAEQAYATAVIHLLHA